MYIYVHNYYVRIDTCTCTYTCMYIQTHYVHTHVHTHLHTHTHVQVHTHVQDVCTYRHIMYIRMYMYIHMYIPSTGTCTCLEYSVSWVRIPPEATLIFSFFHCLRCLSFFLSVFLSFFPENIMYTHVYIHTELLYIYNIAFMCTK